MRSFTSLATAVLVSLCAVATLPAQVSTIPVGFISTNINSGNSAALSFPLDNLTEYAAAASAVTSTTIQTTGAGWTLNQFGSGSFGSNTNPHVVRMVSGALAGRHFRISGNSADTLTIAVPAGTPDLTGAAAGDKYQIVAANTLGSVFGTDNSNLKVFGPNMTTDKLKTDPSASIADNVLINVGAGWLTYWNTGTQWQRVSGGSGSQNNTVLLPEQGFLFVRHDANALPAFTVLGSVPATNLVTDLPAGKSTLLSNRFPIDMKLTTIAGPPVQAGLDLDQRPGWNKNLDVNQADNILINVGTGWLTYWHDGTKWLRVSGGTGAQNPTIKAGTAVLVVRRGGSNIVYNQTLPYALN
jgi:uncharacterized protein (TIGR02597 family)